MGSKYVVFDDGSGAERVVIFDQNLSHKDVAEKMGWRPVSAGTLFVSPGGKMVCMGGSVTLGILDSRPRDVVLVRRMLTGLNHEDEERPNESDMAGDCLCGDGGVGDGMRLASVAAEA